MKYPCLCSSARVCVLVCLQPGRGRGHAGPRGGLDGGCPHLPLRRRRSQCHSVLFLLPPPTDSPPSSPSSAEFRASLEGKGLLQRVVSGARELAISHSLRKQGRDQQGGRNSRARYFGAARRRYSLESEPGDAGVPGKRDSEGQNPGELQSDL